MVNSALAEISCLIPGNSTIAVTPSGKVKRQWIRLPSRRHSEAIFPVGVKWLYQKEKFQSLDVIKEKQIGRYQYLQ